MKRTFFTFLIVIFLVTITTLSTLLILDSKGGAYHPTTDSQEDMLHTIMDTVWPAIVSIYGTASGKDEITTRQWTGIIVQSDGIILTNKHLTSEWFTYTIQLNDTTKMSAIVIKSHPTLDLALLKIVSDHPLSLPVGVFVTSQAGVRSGDTVISISNALGLYPQSISQGIVSGINRTVSLGADTMTGLIQTSSPLSLWSSGGPLIKKDGKIIGINTGIVWGSSQIGWTLPLTQNEVDSFLQ